MDNSLTALLRAVESAGYIVVTDRKSRAMVCTEAGDYVATFRELIPGDYAPEAESPTQR